jgi:hypothetical protein
MTCRGNLVAMARPRAIKGAAGLALALLVSGCASVQALRVPSLAGGAPCVLPLEERDLFVGVALSGGGSRAALFGAASLEALARLRTPAGSSVLEEVQYVSAVSGGTLPAAYLSVHKPARGVPVLKPDGALTEEYGEFFARLRAGLNQDFESALIWRQILSWRWILNSAWAARSLAEVLSERFLGPGTLADLKEREARGDSPRLIFNTTLYNNGRRLAITTLPGEAFRYDFLKDLQASAEQRGRRVDLPPILRQRWESLQTTTPEAFNLNLCPGRLAGAAAASASFPPLVGPTTFQVQVGEEEQYWHVGDGGLYENSGLEALLFVFLKQWQEKRTRRALIVAFDSSFPFSVGGRLLTRRSEPFTLFTYDFSRIPSIMEERATAYAGLFFRSLQVEGVFPDEKMLRIVIVRHIDARWRDDLSDLPEACRNEDPPLTSPAAVTERIGEIATRFVVPSECDRELLVAAAAKVVAQRQGEILEGFASGAPGPAGR